MHARELFPQDEEPGWVGDYQPLLSSIGTIVLQHDENDYQGSSFVLYRHADEFGFLTFGWGSCSGCDALQGCTTWDEVEELRQQLENDVFWGTPDEIVAYLAEAENAGRWYYDDDTFGKFRDEATAVLVPAFRRRLT